MNWTFTHVRHQFRREAEISLNDYCVMDIIYQSHTNPAHSINGWADISYEKMGDFLGLSKGAVHGIIVRMEEIGMIEVNPANPKMKRTTEAWYSNAYLEDETSAKIAGERVKKIREQLNVQKMNVQKMNENRSENERNRSENERNTKINKQRLNTNLNVVCEQTTLTQTKLQKRLNCKNAKHEQAVIEIVDYFNLVTGRKAEYQTAGALKYILHWLNEGHTVADFKTVIDYKTAQFKGTENEKYIALDTYCRFDKFEDNLSKAVNTQATSADPSLNDCDLTPEQAAQYEETKAYIYGKFPNLKEIRFFSHREFLLVSTNDNETFLPLNWRYKATERNMKELKKNAMDKLNTNHFERKAAGSLYEYLRTQIRAELKKD